MATAIFVSCALRIGLKGKKIRPEPGFFWKNGDCRGKLGLTHSLIMPANDPTGPRLRRCRLFRVLEGVFLEHAAVELAALFVRHPVRVEVLDIASRAGSEIGLAFVGMVGNGEAWAGRLERRNQHDAENRGEAGPYRRFWRADISVKP